MYTTGVSVMQTQLQESIEVLKWIPKGKGGLLYLLFLMCCSSHCLSQHQNCFPSPPHKVRKVIWMQVWAICRTELFCHEQWVRLGWASCQLPHRPPADSCNSYGKMRLSHLPQSRPTLQGQRSPSLWLHTGYTYAGHCSSHPELCPCRSSCTSSPTLTPRLESCAFLSTTSWSSILCIYLHLPLT